jgi:hypothetical protein
MTTVLVECADGLYRVELTEDADELADFAPGASLPPRPRPLELVPSFAGSHLVDVDTAGTTIVVLVSRRPPLLVSHDLGQTWNERGSGLPPGRSLALGATPDEIVYAARNRLFLSSDGGTFWRALLVELPEILGVAWA